jgi:hypothetical protein
VLSSSQRASCINPWFSLDAWRLGLHVQAPGLYKKGIRAHNQLRSAQTRPFSLQMEIGRASIVSEWHCKHLEGVLGRFKESCGKVLH